ncbi:MAG: hypothetical protein BECKG1743D_GA0114223_102742 [Candidatus Kentron sp. G]|nr:MAG: hypothetical protein BECKG1743D_GA0114223_102742 [Candidatus Kentron sp. G]
MSPIHRSASPNADRWIPMRFALAGSPASYFPRGLFFSLVAPRPRFRREDRAAPPHARTLGVSRTGRRRCRHWGITISGSGGLPSPGLGDYRLRFAATAVSGPRRGRHRRGSHRCGSPKALTGILPGHRLGVLQLPIPAMVAVPLDEPPGLFQVRPRRSPGIFLILHSYFFTLNS